MKLSTSRSWLRIMRNSLGRNMNDLEKRFIELMKKCYYVSFLGDVISKTSYGYDHPEEVRELCGILDELKRGTDV